MAQPNNRKKQGLLRGPVFFRFNTISCDNFYIDSMHDTCLEPRIKAILWERGPGVRATHLTKKAVGEKQVSGARCRVSGEGQLRIKNVRLVSNLDLWLCE